MCKRTFDLALAGMILFALGAVIPVGEAAAQSRRVTGAAGSNDVERIQPIVVDDVYTYSVKMLCGTVFADPDFRQFPNVSADPLLVPGTYLTAINFHNPGDQTEVTTTPVDASGPGGITLTAIVPANTMGSFDCNGFLGNLDPSQTSTQRRVQLQTRLEEGYAVLRSSTEIAVTAIYTFKNVEAPAYLLFEADPVPPR